MTLRTVPIPLMLVLAAPSAGLTQVQVVQDDEWCDRERGWERDRGWFCEVRETTLSAGRDVIAVAAEPNGSVYVEGWDRDQVLLRVRVSAQARTDGDAADLVHGVELITDRFAIRADGPRTGRREHWSASYELFVPRRSNLDLSSTNGSIHIVDVAGRLEFRTTNGGVHLSRLAGDVRGQTTNGGLDIELSGTEWDGPGMDVRTTNGGIRLDIPASYSARLETGTTNGGMRVDFPITVQGRIDRHITAELGRGGRVIRAITTNGGVVIRRG